MAAETSDLARRMSSPVRTIPGDPTEPSQGLALCLSGGGYRAMLFHVGVLWRLNEAGVLPRLDRVSSVSGGSITAGVLALHWAQLEFDDTGRANAFSKIVDDIRRFASVTVDVGAVLTGVIGLAIRLRVGSSGSGLSAGTLRQVDLAEPA